MDDTDKTQGQTPNQQQSQAGGGGTLVKEREAPIVSPTESSVSEFVGPSEVEPKIHDELAGMDVRHVHEFPTVGPEERKVGIEPVGESVPVKTEPSGLAQIPKTEEEAKQELKHENSTSSNWGRLMLFVKFFKQIHHKLLTSKN